MLRKLRQFCRGKRGMEMVEWSIVAIIFAVASALLWTTLRGNISTALTTVGDCVSTGNCPVIGAGS